MDIALVFCLIFIMAWMVYMTLGFHARQRRLEFRMDGLEEQIKRELNASFQQITNTRLIATTVDARTDKFPSVIDAYQELIKRISKLESDMSGVNTTLEYIKLLKQQQTRFEKDLTMLEQTAGGMAKASTELMQAYEPIREILFEEMKQH